MNLERDTLKNIVEAAVMAAEAPLTVRQILGLFPEEACPERDEVQQAIGELQEACEGRGVELRKVGKGYRYQTREDLAPWLRKLNEGRPPRYSRALLETLAIIAYRQPVSRGDIEEIRGVAVSSDIMRTLQDREWVKQVGVRDVPGHPALYGTTPTFLAYFNLESLRELPALIEQRDLEDIAKEQNIQLPINIVADDDAEPGEENSDDTAPEDMDETGENKAAEEEAGESPADVVVSGDIDDEETDVLEPVEEISEAWEEAEDEDDAAAPSEDGEPADNIDIDETEIGNKEPA